MMYSLGSGTLTEDVNVNKYCGTTHIFEVIENFTGTLSGTGSCGTASKSYTGSKYHSYNFCSLLAPELNKSKLKAAISKGKAKLKGN